MPDKPLYTAWVRFLFDRVCRLACIVVFVSSIGDRIVSAEEAAPDEKLKSNDWLTEWLYQDYMLGDWGGNRTRLSRDYGLNFEIFYIGGVPLNLDGGLQTGSVYEGALLVAMDFSPEKTLGYSGGQFHVSSLWIHGEAFSDDYVGDINKVSMLDLTHAIRLWELWYKQSFLEGRLSVKFGQMAIDQDFIVPEMYNSLASIHFLNQTFFYPTTAFNVYDRPFYPVEDHALASTPFAAPGFLLRVGPHPQWYFQAAVYGGNPDRSYHGTEFNLSESEGALSYFEMGFRHNMEPDDTGLPGSIKMGAFYHSDSYSDTEALLGTLGLPWNGMVHDDNYGLYVLAEQMLYRETGPEDPAGQGLIAFARYGYSPPDRNLYDWGADGGVVYRGPVPGRDYDALGVAFSYLSVSREVQDVQRRVNAVAPGSFPEADYEAVLEMTYKAQVTAWMTAQLSAQRVFHPGANLVSQTPDAWVLITQTTWRF